MSSVLQVLDGYSSKSFRMLAVAVGVIKNVHKLDLARMTQQQVELSAVDMQLLGLVVLTTSLRTDARRVVSQVQDE